MNGCFWSWNGIADSLSAQSRQSVNRQPVDMPHVNSEYSYRAVLLRVIILQAGIRFEDARLNIYLAVSAPFPCFLTC